MIITTKKDLVWSYLAQIFKYGSSLFLLPIVLINLPSDQLAIWYIFTSINALIFLLDFGFQPNITRNVTYVFSGANKLLKEGVELFIENNEINYPLLYALIKTIKKIYRKLAVAGFIILLSAGSLYYTSIIGEVKSVSREFLWISWIIFAIATVFNFYFTYLKCLLIGKGLIQQAQKASILTAATYLIIGLIGLKLGYGLIALTLATLISSLVNRTISYNYFYESKLKSELNKSKISRIDNKELFPIIWHNAKKMGLVILGGFLINQANILIIPKFLSLDMVAKFGLMKQLIAIITTISAIFFTTYTPKMNSLFIIRRNDKLIKILGISLIIFAILFLLASLILIFMGNNLLNLIGSHTLLLPTQLILIMLLIGLLDQQHTMMANVLTFSNYIPFVKASLISGIIYIIISFLLLKYTSIGLYAVIIPGLLVQLAYNNWKWPLEASKMLKVNYSFIWKSSFKTMHNLLAERIN